MTVRDGAHRDRLKKGAFAEPEIARTTRPPRDPAARRRAERIGRRAETYVAWRLRLTGWRILEMRARTAAGEIDLIARRHGTLAFIEVKARRSFAAAERAITPRQRVRIARAAEAWLAKALKSDLMTDSASDLAPRLDLAHHRHRFDAALVVGLRVRMIEDAWRAGDA